MKVGDKVIYSRNWNHSYQTFADGTKKYTKSTEEVEGTIMDVNNKTVNIKFSNGNFVERIPFNRVKVING